MSLLSKCYETYENYQHLSGEILENGLPLVPIAHSLQNATLEITLDGEGNFVSAVMIGKDDIKTIVPVTIESGGRTSKPVPHPLCDNLQYLSSVNLSKYQSYVEGLRNWTESGKYSDPKIRAVLNYVERQTILDDLCKAGILPTSDLDEKSSKFFVRWRINGLGENVVAECWRDSNLFGKWIGYYFESLDDGAEKSLCMLSGRQSVISENHPKNILAISGNAKLVSANDNTNFTYRGRFSDSSEAYSIGYEASQKAHNALRWLVSKGKIIGGRAFLCWSPYGYRVPQPWSPLIFATEERLDFIDYHLELQDALTGYRNNLPSDADVIIASLDAATTGRLSVTYYSEVKAVDFLNRIEQWYATCCWPNGKFGIQSPSAYNIVRFAYGIERDTGKIDTDDILLRDYQQRLFKCIVEGSLVPYDIVRALFNRATRPECYSKNNYCGLLWTACAVIRKYLNDKFCKEVWDLELDKEKRNRSYLFGRLLAVFERVEAITYAGTEETRETNAMRLQSAFCGKPMYYAHVIHSQLNPYFARLNPGQRGFYKKIIGEIMEKLSGFSPVELNQPLQETYLLGYYLQRSDFFKTKKDNDMEVSENE